MPREEDEAAGVPFSGPVGVVVRKALADAGVDPLRTSFAYLTRCRSGDPDGPDAVRAEKKCRSFFVGDTAEAKKLLVLGLRPLRLLVDPKARVGASRGLWHRATDGRDAFSARDPASFLSSASAEVRDRLLEEFRADVSTMADRVLGREPASRIVVQTYGSVREAEPFLLELASHPGPWAFDVEAYDARAFPSRKNVSTDPCHPDFRLRGIAFAASSKEGAWVDCLESSPSEARPFLAQVFGSSAEKWAFNGHYDEEAVVYPGWTDVVRCRAGDGMLGLLALSDGEHESLRLEYAVVNVLGERQYWRGIDKARMKVVPTAVVAANAVGDACYTYRLCEVIHKRLAKGEYFSWS